MKVYQKPMLSQESLYISDTAIASSECYYCFNSGSTGGTPTHDVPAGANVKWECTHFDGEDKVWCM